VVLSINQELCNGCEACIEACPTDAIVVSDGKAKIDELLCTSCESCISLCPVEAIQKAPDSTLAELTPHSSGVSNREIRISKSPVGQNLSHETKSGSLLGQIGLALYSLGRDALPYIADGLTNVLEQRIASPGIRSIPSSTQPNARNNAHRMGQGLPQRKRQRARRGRKN
jgi:NAD-dependent dihydropyrimidine dehydrogenase PreA subunit